MISKEQRIVSLVFVMVEVFAISCWIRIIIPLMFVLSIMVMIKT